jgi:hypothetical protein
MRGVQFVTRYPKASAISLLHSCSGCFRLERLPGDDLQPLERAAFHGAHPKRSFRMSERILIGVGGVVRVAASEQTAKSESASKLSWGSLAEAEAPTRLSPLSSLLPFRGSGERDHDIAACPKTLTLRVLGEMLIRWRPP